MDKNKMRQYRTDLQEAINGVIKKHGFQTVSIGTITYSDTEIKCKLTVMVDAAKAQYKMAVTYGIYKVGSMIDYAGKIYKIEGYTPRGHYIVTDPNAYANKRYRISSKTNVKLISEPGINN